MCVRAGGGCLQRTSRCRESSLQKKSCVLSRSREGAGGKKGWEGGNTLARTEAKCIYTQRSDGDSAPDASAVQVSQGALGGQRWRAVRGVQWGVEQDGGRPGHHLRVGR